MPYDALITRDGPVNAPLDYVVPNNANVMPGVVAATFADPTNAGPYVPCVEVLTPSGLVLGPFPLGTTIAAGGSARVVWFQGVGGSDGAPAAAALQAVRVNIVGDQAIPQGDPGTIVTWGEAAFDTGSPTPFWAAGSPTLLTAPVDGYYLSMPAPIWDVFAPGIAADAEFAFYMYHGAQVPDGFHALAKEGDNPQGATHFLFAGQHHALTFLNAGDTVKINAYFNQGTSGVASINLKDLRTVGYSTLTSSWSMVLVAAA